MTHPRIRIIKVGGSLLEYDQLSRLLTDWLAQTDRDQTNESVPTTDRIDVLIAGGGGLADHVRQLDRRFSLDSETSHWMSIGAMSCTSRLLASLLRVGPPRVCWGELHVLAGDCSEPIVFDAQAWLVKTERSQPGVRLTHDWQTTSDSIAARLARVLNADELVLLKSTDLPAGTDWCVAGGQGLVDEHFHRIAAELPSIVWVNLRQLETRSAVR